MINETDEKVTIYDKQLNKYLNDNLTNIIAPDLKYIRENGNFCFVKIEFYLNGEIKNYYLPIIPLFSLFSKTIPLLFELS